MNELTIEQVQRLAKKASGTHWYFQPGWGLQYCPEPGSLGLLIPDGQECGAATVNDFDLMAAAPDLAALAISLHDQLQRERAEHQQLRRDAECLYDNRLGWSDGRNPYAPPEYWDAIGAALGRDPAGFCSPPQQQAQAGETL